MLDTVIITCAITGNFTTREQNSAVPITPGEITDSALGAAEAGAAIVHLHVRDPQSGVPSMELEYYREVVERIRAKNPGLILNLTTGPGARFVPSEADPKVAGPGTTLTTPERRIEHIRLLKPDICSLDLNTMMFGDGILINTPSTIRYMASVIRAAGVVPEIELFDSGDVALCADLVRDGTLQASPLCCVVMGIKYGFQPSPETVLYARNLLPPGARWTAFGTSRHAFPMVAQSVLAGGHVRIGLEDTIYLNKGELATSNASLVEKARRIIEELGPQVASSRKARELLKLS
jgi:uncharacterized protein (DUF849 family)